MKLKLNFVKCANEIVKVTDPKSEFIIDDSNRHIIDGIFWWCFNDERSCYNLNKGILIKGDKGTGKTTIILAFRKFMSNLQNDGFRFSSASKIALDYVRNGNIDEWIKREVVAIDEIGTENMGKHYGNELNVIAYLLHERYSIWRSTGICTIATTNEDADGIERKYGDIIRDRVKEMFNHVIMAGDSRRK